MWFDRQVPTPASLPPEAGVVKKGRGARDAGNPGNAPAVAPNGRPDHRP